MELIMLFFVAVYVVGVVSLGEYIFSILFYGRHENIRLIAALLWPIIIPIMLISTILGIKLKKD
jgi:hypothetical protein